MNPLHTGRAIIAGDYRYMLSRSWGDGKRVLWVMLNPSTADAYEDDQTIRKCAGFTKQWNCDGFDVVNLFAFRSTDAKVLNTVADPVGALNDEIIRFALRSPHLWRVVCAWGVSQVRGLAARSTEVVRLIESETRVPWALQRTKSGSPSHPLMLPYSLEPEIYGVAVSA